MELVEQCYRLRSDDLVKESLRHPSSDWSSEKQCKKLGIALRTLDGQLQGIVQLLHLKSRDKRTTA